MEGPVRTGVVPNGSLNGVRPCENAEMPEMGKEVRGMKGPGTLEHKYTTIATHIYTQAHTHDAYHAALGGVPNMCS